MREIHNGGFDARELEARTNLNTIKALKITTVAFFLIWGLAMLGVFPLNRGMMSWVFLGSAALMLAPAAICRWTGTEARWVKYMLMGFACAALTLIGCALTHHSVLLFALPLIYAAQYSERKMILLVFAMSVACMCVCVYLGYHIGLCDANMLLLTQHPLDYYLDAASGSLRMENLEPNDRPWMTLALYFLLPRCMILAVLVPVLRKISETIRLGVATAARLQYLSETDKATRFYNRNKYEEMLAEHYPTVDRVGVVFWDINNLKSVNDRYGHAYGDALIGSVAECIYALAEGRKVYRLGGDEFVMFLEGEDVDNLDALLERWYGLIEAERRANALPVSVAVGSASGAGKNVTELIAEADREMYRNKWRIKRRQDA